MRSLFCILLWALLSGCASTYHLPENERSRTYERSFDDVWAAALSSAADVNFAIVETEPEHGRILARTGWTIWDLKGHMIVIVISDAVQGLIRVDANAEAVSEDTVVDFGASARKIRKYLRALDHELRVSTP